MITKFVADNKKKLPMKLGDDTEIVDLRQDKTSIQYVLKVQMKIEELDTDIFKNEIEKFYIGKKCNSEIYKNQKILGIEEYYSYFDSNDKLISEVHLNKICK